MSELELFAAALAIADSTERSRYLDQACGPDTALRHQLEVLLWNHENAGSFMESPAGMPIVAAEPKTPEVTQDLSSQESDESDRSRQEVNEVNMTEAESSGANHEGALDFLQPSTKPGSRGRLGHYEVLEVLGQGGFGVVVRAFDEKLQRVVAIKLMSPQLAATSPARKRFLREARASAKVRHENVVQIYAVEEQPIPYLVMEYIPGRTLQQKLDATGPLEAPEMLRLGVQVARGLAAAHAQGLIHRDIKPGNILLEESLEPHAKITDFGLARAADDASLTQSGVVAGTPMYMAPEQAEGKAIDQRADLFSLGSVFYVMLSGRPPFRASGTMAVLKRVCEDAPRPIREIIPEVPEWLCDIIAKLHAKKPEDRFQTAKEVAELLGQRLADVQAGRSIPSAGRGSPDPALGVDRRSPEPLSEVGDLRSGVPAGSGDPRRAQGNGASRRRLKIAAALGAIALLLAGVFATPFLYRYVTNQSTLIYSGTMDPNLDKILVKQQGDTIAELTTTNGMVRVPSGDYQVEVVCKAGYELSKYRVGSTGSGPTDWQIAQGQSFPLRLARADHVSINLELTKLPDDPSKEPRPEPGWVQLFNRKDLDGWHVGKNSPKDAWKVVNGILKGQTVGQSMLFSNRADFKDFHLRVKARIEAGANSGIDFRSTATKNYQADIHSASDVPTGSLWRSLELLVTAPAVHATKPGEWFILEVIAQGSRIKIRVNDQTTAEVADTTSTEGRFALQIRGKGGSVEFEKIEIMELPPEEPGWVQLFNGKDLDGWKMNAKMPWSVENGLLVTRVAKDDPRVTAGVNLYTKRQDYQNFHVRLEAKINQAGDSGLYFRKLPGNAGHQAQIHLAKDGTGTLLRDKEKFLSKASVKPDTWFLMEVIAQGRHIVIKVDGKKVVDWQDPDTDPETLSGAFGLETGNPGTELYVKKIEIKELPSEEPGWVQLFNGKDLTGWEKSEHWKVIDNVLTGSAKEGQHYLTSHHGPFANFRLRANVRFQGSGFGALIVRANAPQHYSVLLSAKKSGSLAVQSPWRWLAHKQHDLVRPEGWFELEFIADGSQLVSKVNGEVVAKATDKTSSRGSFVLGLNAFDGPVVVQFKKIEVKELPPDSKASFVILAKDKRSEWRHATLADAVKAAQSGDTIEIRGDGPFETEPISLGKKGFTIRAGEGFRPHLKCQLTDPESKESLLQSEGPLVLEGLTLEQSGNPEAKTWLDLTAVITAKDAPVRIANCRLLTKHLSRGINLVHVPDSFVTNCIIVGDDTSKGGMGLTPPRRSSRTVLANNLILTNPGNGLSFNAGAPEVEKASITLQRNSFHTTHSMAIFVGYAEDPEKLKQVRFPLTATGNVFSSQVPFYLNPASTTVALEKTASLLPKLFAFRADDNLYGLWQNRILQLTRAGTPSVLMIESLKEWHDLWDITESRSQIGTPDFVGGETLGKPITDPTAVAPADFRLAPGSPGKGAGKDDKDLGADVDLVGPGAAYEKWKKTKEYEEWRKQTDAMIAAAVTPPFVILAKDKHAETQHATLADAVKTAQSGDTIEIRGDGPFEIAPINLGKKALAIRAGAGFRPHLIHQPVDPDAKGAMLLTAWPLVLEGLTLERRSNPGVKGFAPGTHLVAVHDAPVRMANCRLIGHQLNTTLTLKGVSDGVVTNCEILGDNGNRVAIEYHAPVAGRLLLDNNLLVSHSGFDHGIFDLDHLDKTENVVVSLRRQTILAISPLTMHTKVPLDPVRLADPKRRRLRLDAVGNILAGEVICTFGVMDKSVSVKDAIPLLPRLLSYQDEDNLYSATSNAFLVSGRDGEFIKTMNSLGEWHKYWDIAKSRSQVGKPGFVGGDIFARTLADPAAVTAADFRLAKGSLGKDAGAGGTDLGADVDLVGPGAAYERWKQTPAYQEWASRLKP